MKIEFRKLSANLFNAKWTSSRRTHEIASLKLFWCYENWIFKKQEENIDYDEKYIKNCK